MSGIKLIDPATGLEYRAGGSASANGDAATPLNTQSAYLPAATDRSGTAATSSGQIIAANPTRRGLDIQNVGANNIGINEFGGAAVIGGASTYTLTPGSTMRVRTNRAIFAIAATGATAFTATEW